MYKIIYASLSLVNIPRVDIISILQMRKVREHLKDVS